MSDTQTPYTGSNYTAPVDAVYDPPGTLTSGAAYCPECVRLRAELARVTSERDALAKRWEAIKSHVVGMDDDACVPAVDEWDAGWSEAFSDVREKMRELEAGE